jgi:EmrB/QacA subfamily drug resistance transporter
MRDVTPPAPGDGARSLPRAGDRPGSRQKSLTGRRQRVTLVAGSMAGFMIGLDATVVTTALPTISNDLHVSISTLGWTVSAYSLAYAALILVGTALGDKFGRRRVFLAGVALFTLASAACAVSPDVASLIAARAVQGAGGGIATPLSLVLISEAYPPSRRGMVVGAWGAITGIAVGLGPVVGGAIVQGLAWQWVFWLNVPVGLVLVTVGRRVLAESRGPARRLDPAGLVLATGAVFAFTDALLRGPDLGWGSAEVLGLFAGGAVLAGAFVVAEQRGQQPMLPLRLFANASLSGAVTTRFALFATVFGCAFLVPQYLQLARGFTPLRTGLGVLPFTGPTMLVPPLAGRLADRLGERVLILAGFAADAAGFAWLAAAVTPATSYLHLLGPLLLAGAGVGLAVPTTVSASLRAVPAPQVGLASGIGSTFQNVGGVFGVATATAVFASTGRHLTPAGFTAGLPPALAALAGLAAVGLLAGLATGPRRQPGASRSPSSRWPRKRHGEPAPVRHARMTDTATEDHY